MCDFMKWTKQQLDGQRVEFNLLAENVRYKGIGTFDVQERPGDILFIQIVQDLPGQTPDDRVSRRYTVAQEDARRIEIHPDSSVAAYRLLGR